MKTQKLTFFYLFFLSMVTFGFSQDFSTYDKNSDGRLDEDEFGENHKNDFEQWDADRNGTVNAVEFNQSTFNTADRNGDGSIDEIEWDEGSARMYGDFIGTMGFNTFDEDSDGVVIIDEWDKGFSDNDDWFMAYDVDRDGTVDNEEWNTGFFTDWDDNGDGFLDEDEYAVIVTYYNPVGY